MAEETPSSIKPLVPMFGAPSSKNILFADSVATLANARQMSAEEFSKKHNIRWTESNLGNPDKKVTFEDPQNNQTINEKIAIGALLQEIHSFVVQKRIKKCLRYTI